jgi:hypothetical protein
MGAMVNHFMVYPVFDAHIFLRIINAEVRQPKFERGRSSFLPHLTSTSLECLQSHCPLFYANSPVYSPY